MTLDEGATAEILARWPEHKQRNTALDRYAYGPNYFDGMVAGIKLVREHHAELEKAGATVWTIPAQLAQLLDDLAAQ